jgi:2-desacetyl-2-hydroxyethyl bacteriochlorophyllide A dehydrogenase
MGGINLKACIFKGPYKIGVEEAPIPKISKNDVLVNIKVAGICGSDLEIYRGKRAVKTPIIMGHEAVGIVVEKGRDVENVNIGDFVVIEPNVYCGICYQCRKGRTDLCENKVIYGITRDGVFAEYVDVPSNFVWKLPDKIAYEDAVLIEPLSCVLRALRHLNKTILPSDNILIIGGGPLGAIAATILQHMNVNVVVQEILPSRIELLKKIGIEKVVDTSKENADDIMKSYLEGSKADYVLDTVGNTASFSQAIKWIKPGGKMVVMGLLGLKAEVDIYPLVRGTLQIEGSVIYLGDYFDAIKLINKESIMQKLRKTITHKYKLDECQEAFKTAEQGRGIKVAIEI